MPSLSLTRRRRVANAQRRLKKDQTARLSERLGETDGRILSAALARNPGLAGAPLGQFASARAVGSGAAPRSVRCKARSMWTVGAEPWQVSPR